MSLLNELFMPEDIKRIRSISLNLNQDDKIMWAHTRNGLFTIKSAYKSYVNEDYSIEYSLFWKKVWSLECLPKIRFSYGKSLPTCFR